MAAYTKVEGCVKYSQDNKCLECGNTLPYLIIANVGVSCSATCDDTNALGVGSAIILDNLDGRVNICVFRNVLGPMTGYGVVPTDVGAYTPLG